MKNLFILLSILCLFVGVRLYGDVASSDSALVVILMGPPGSGKGTQAVKLSQELGIPHISTGDLFRENIKKNTALGKKANEFISQGKLVPDEVTLDMLFDRVSKPDCAKGYLLDGFPRTVAQAEALDRRVPSNARLVVINLNVADEAIVKRVTGRLMCKACGNIQHREFSPPKEEGKCDKCGGELYQRSDDTEPVVKERLRVYHEQTEPVIGYYAKKGLLQEVNGEQSPDAVFNDLMQKFEAIRQ